MAASRANPEPAKLATRLFHAGRIWERLTPPSPDRLRPLRRRARDPRGGLSGGVRPLGSPSERAGRCRASRRSTSPRTSSSLVRAPSPTGGCSAARRRTKRAGPFACFAADTR
jgi:hypothetical protein